MLQSELEINTEYTKTKGMKIVNNQWDWAQKGLAMTKKLFFILRLFIDYIEIVQSELLANLFWHAQVNLFKSVTKQ